MIKPIISRHQITHTDSQSRKSTKNKSPIILITALVIRKYNGDWLSPNALNVLAKQLYINVKMSPANMIRR